MGLLHIFCALWALAAVAYADHTFENTAIVRVVEVESSLAHARTAFAVRALETGSSIYAFALSAKENEHTSYMEAHLKGQSEPLEIRKFGRNSASGAYLFAVVLPKALRNNESVTIEVETVQTHATYPWPKHVGQGEEATMKYESDLFILSPYETVVQRTKIRTPNDKVVSYTKPTKVDEFTLDAPATKSGQTITYGPFNNIPPSVTADFVENFQQRIVIHYTIDTPALQITNLKRSAEISHWGANLNIQDEISLRNAGPELKSHFSRLEHQQQAYFRTNAGHILRAVTLHLPPGINNVYYYDLIGNVSTSKLRPAPSIPKGAAATSNVRTALELRPRYPMPGGWNYSFTLGWDSSLTDSASYDHRDGRYIVSVPIFTQFPDTVIDEAELNIILPEGATELEVYTPFPPKDKKLSTHKTYLDTKGRPTISFKYSQLTDRHQGYVYVAYKVPLVEHLRKPLTIAAAFSGLFMLAFVIRRIDTSIQKKL